jgi:hypothetical protein
MNDPEGNAPAALSSAPSLTALLEEYAEKQVRMSVALSAAGEALTTAAQWARQAALDLLAELEALKDPKPAAPAEGNSEGNNAPGGPGL